ncbi:hypothetical protein IQ247_10510 [Plectonema cf. radiosum LEGE 06105]|uniref:Uncharacterized protein n=1 Tax=Plectonema cf. radiosum LEGE 06105 TaxID=945769 RepID=A0A8J7JU71_9CYAN|nr:hypothetical protein [Plectonema radiosum]MBE9213100.1 hypothetical protein [Plectonema cf. radiosum LEGE 06105]
MAKNWNVPQLTTFGSVEELTQVKFAGSDDGTALDIDGPNNNTGVISIGDQFTGITLVPVS